MKTIKMFILLCVTLLTTSICTAQKSSNPLLEDFEKLIGNWEGTLIYLDYSSGKPYTMSANVEINRINKSNKLVFFNSYPKEASANSVDTITFSEDGKYIEKELVKSRRKLPNGDIEITTEEKGEDGNDNKPAILRHTYILGSATFVKRKDVQFIGESEWINRSEYAYKKKPSR